MNAVQLSQVSTTVAELRWESNTSNDMIADSALALLLGIDSSPATVKRKSGLPMRLTIVTSNPHPHSHSHSHSHAHSHAVTNGENGDASDTEDFERLRRFLTAHFGDVSMPSEDDDDALLVIDIKVDNLEARVDLITMVSKHVDITDPQRVESENEQLKKRVEAVLEMALATMTPLSLAFVGQGLDTLKAENGAE